jgi:hypothetical protein
VKGQEVGPKCTVRSFIICTLHETVIRMIKFRWMRWAGYVQQTGQVRNRHKILFRKHKVRWEANTTGDLKNKDGGVHRLRVAQDRTRWRAAVKTIMTISSTISF